MARELPHPYAGTVRTARHSGHWHAAHGRAILFLSLLAILAAWPARADATVTFGADLSLAPNLSFHCPLPPPFFIAAIPWPDTCTAFTSGVFGGGPARASHLVPAGTGVITKLRLREPNAVSSPLRMTVLRALRSPLSTVAVCCTVTSQSPPFTPQPGGISEVTFNPPIPVHAITTVTGVYEFEAVALTATDGASIIPAGSASGHSSGAYFPAALPGQERHESQASLGTDTQILFEADWEPVDTGATPVPSSPGAGTPVTLPTVTPTGTPTAPLALKGGRFTATRATVPLVCARTAACRGTLRLESRRPVTRAATAATTAAAAKKPILYGRARFSVKAGKTASVAVTLNAKGRHLVRRRSQVRIYANAAIGGQVLSTKVRLKRR